MELQWQNRGDSDTHSNSTRTVPASAAYVMKPEDRPNHTAIHQPPLQDMFESPRTRQRFQQAQTAAACEMIAAEIHDMECANIDNFCLIACLLHVPSAPRWVEIIDKRSRDEKQVPVFTALLTDNTGPITLELWRKQADYVLYAMDNWESREQGPIFMTVKYLLSSKCKFRQSKTDVANGEHREL